MAGQKHPSPNSGQALMDLVYSGGHQAGDVDAGGDTEAEIILCIPYNTVITGHLASIGKAADGYCGTCAVGDGWHFP